MREVVRVVEQVYTERNAEIEYVTRVTAYNDRHTSQSAEIDNVSDKPGDGYDVVVFARILYRKLQVGFQVRKTSFLIG